VKKCSGLNKQCIVNLRETGRAFELLCCYNVVPHCYASTTLSNKWKSALVVHSSLVEDPTIQQPGFDLPRRYLALLNCFRTNQGQCASCQKMSGLEATDMCRTTSHIVNSCPQTKLEGGLQRLHSADDVATEWLNAFDSNNNFQTFLTTHRI